VDESNDRPLSYGRQTIDADDRAAVDQVLQGDWLSQGPKIAEFEGALCGHFGAANAVVVSSGTAALHLASLTCDLQPGDRVITSPLTFLAGVNCLRYCQATPLFVDVDPMTQNIDLQQVEDLLADAGRRKDVRGITAVHFAGMPLPMNALSRLADRYGLFFIDDASHGIGGRFRLRDGSYGVIGDGGHSTMTTCSFHPVKHLTTGEGGAILTNDSARAERLRSLRNHGVTKNPDRFRLEPDGPWHHEMHELGFNYRISDLQCALGIRQLMKLDGWLARRGELVANYRAALAQLPGVSFVEEEIGLQPAWHLFVALFEGPATRLHVYKRLKEQGIHTQVHYMPVHLHPYYRELLGARRGDFPHAEATYDRCLSLPLFPTMTDDDQGRVVEALRGSL